MDNNELAHVGVLGMKWGRRKASRATSSTSSKQHIATVGKKLVKNGPAKPEKYVRPANLPPKRLTDAQLRSRINRIEMEKKYSLLTAKQVSPAKKMISDILTAAVKKTATDYVTAQMGKGLAALTVDKTNTTPTPTPTPNPTPSN